MHFTTATVRQESSKDGWEIVEMMKKVKIFVLITRNVIIFEKKNKKWIMESWDETVWSKTGSADGFIWPLIR